MLVVKLDTSHAASAQRRGHARPVAPFLLQSYNQHRVARFIAILLLAVLLGSLHPGGVFYRCQFDGEVRAVCCCEQTDNRAPRQVAGQQVRGECCDLVVRPSATYEASRVDPQPLRVQMPVVAALPAWLPRTPVRTHAAEPFGLWRGPPRPGGPLFLQICSLLL